MGLKTCKLQVHRGREFIVIAPFVLESLLDLIRKQKTTRLEILAETVLPPAYTDYLINVLNSNRDKKMFEFSFISEMLISREQIYKIAEQQFYALKAGDKDCFKKFEYILKNEEHIYRLEIDEYFLKICVNTRNGFWYVYPGKKKMKIFLD